MSSGNLFEKIPESLPKEIIETILETGQLRVERILSRGHASEPDFWYCQLQNEWVCLLSGSAVLQFPDEEINLLPGDYLLIPAKKKHRVKSTASNENSVWLVIFFP